LNDRFGTALAVVERLGKRQIELQVSCPTARQARSLVLEFGGKAEKLPRDWLRDFAKQAQPKPLRIGSKRTIVIPAEAAFGTGEHATTAMCLRLLERHTRSRARGWSMLDAGTGSGILAIAARCLGAARVIAIDNDPVACTVAKRNARRNGVGKIEFRTGDLLNLKLTNTFDVITANLYSEILIAALPRWSRHLAADGFLILSGILRSQEKEVSSALGRNGFALREARRRGKWVALAALKRTAQRAVPT
jgi:ribosomal protein L11 methyltransferase